jgi:membrane protein implicated in regulation of membrane protease activity
MACEQLTPLAVILAASTDAAGARPVQHAWLLFGTITLLLILFVAVVALSARRWRRRHHRPGPSAPAGGDGVDAWAEAGRRASPYPEREIRK